MAMDIRQLRYFVTTVEEGTISAAARKLHISQPPLSTQLRLLEAEYGITLFERGSRQISLTDAGKMLYRYACEILTLENAAAEDLQNLRLCRKGSIRMGLISSADSPRLYNGLHRFHAEHPDIDFKIFEGNTYELLDDLKKGKIELAVIRTPFPESDLKKLVLQTDPMCAAGNTGMMFSLFPDESAPLPLKDLAGVPLIIYRRWEKILREAFEREGIEPEIICTCDDARTGLSFASAGIGICLLPASIANYRQDTRSIPLCEPSLTSSICFVRLRSQELTQSAESLYQLLGGLFKDAR